VIPREVASAADTPGRPGRAFQVAIRYVAMDGFDTRGTAVGEKSVDTKNGFFTFHVPEGQEHLQLDAPDAYDWLCAPCWTGRDLTGEAGGSQFGACQDAWFDCLPRFDLWKENFIGSGEQGARLAWGGADTGRGSTATSVPMWADGLVATPLPDTPIGARITVDPDGTRRYVGIISGRSARLVGNGVSATIVGNTVLDLGGLSQPRLVALDGEVFAIKGSGSQAPWGVGLLDAENAPVTHAIGQAPVGLSAQARTLPGFLVLPVGPVTRFADRYETPGGHTLTGSFYYFQTPELRAPLALVCGRDGAPTAHEVLGTIGPLPLRWRVGRDTVGFHYFFRADWMRGLYNTPQGGLDGDQVVIGWWPRYAPCLPQRATAQHLRSRSYPWVGFPLRLFDSSFDTALFAGDPIAEVTVVDEIDQLFALDARAMATGTDWSTVPASELRQGGNSNLNAAFMHGQFAGRTVDGAELKVSWRYNVPPSGDLRDLAAAGNRVPPRVGPTRLRCLAPAKILATEYAR
jgi:hypothetical protein